MVMAKERKNTEIGIIPFEWECSLIEDILLDVSMGPFGSDIKVENFQKHGVPVLNGFNVKNVVLNDKFNNFVSPMKAYSLNKAVAHRGDIVVTHRGTLGQVSVIPKDSFYESYVVSQSQFRATFDHRKVEPLFVGYFFHSTLGQNILLEKKGHTGVPALAQPTTNFRKLFIPLPPLLEQRRIAEALSDTDKAISAFEKLIDKKRNIKQGAMQELLTGKRRLHGFEGDWTNMNLVENSTLKARIGWHGLTTAEYLNDGYAYLITGTDFANGKIAWETCYYVDKRRYDQDTNIQVLNGDVLITKDGTIGKVAIVNGLSKKATLNSGVFLLRPKSSVYDHRYVYYVLMSQIFTDFLDKLAAGSTIIHLYQKDFVNFEFNVPPTLSEQTAIAEILSDMDAEIDELTAKLDKLRSIKQGMMSELLTGQIRLSEQESESKPSAGVIKLLKREPEAAAIQAGGHNHQFDDAVMIAGIVNKLYSEKYPLGRKKVQKCLYLLRRHQDESTAAFKKKAAGPYADEVRYKGGEPIAKSNKYITTTTVKDKGTTFARGCNIDQALGYINSWGKQDDIKWVAEKLKFKKVDELELLATVDMAICDLEETGTAVSVASIKHLIATNEEWKAKLKKLTFSDANIARAIKELQTLL